MKKFLVTFSLLGFLAVLSQSASAQPYIGQPGLMVQPGMQTGAACPVMQPGIGGTMIQPGIQTGPAIPITPFCPIGPVQAPTGGAVTIYPCPTGAAAPVCVPVIPQTPVVTPPPVITPPVVTPAPTGGAAPVRGMW